VEIHLKKNCIYKNKDNNNGDIGCSNKNARGNAQHGKRDGYDKDGILESIRNIPSKDIGRGHQDCLDCGNNTGSLNREAFFIYQQAGQPVSNSHHYPQPDELNSAADPHEVEAEELQGGKGIIFFLGEGRRRVLAENQEKEDSDNAERSQADESRPPSPLFDNERACQVEYQAAGCAANQVKPGSSCPAIGRKPVSDKGHTGNKEESPENAGNNLVKQGLPVFRDKTES